MKDYKIKTFEDACKSEGINPELLPEVSMLPARFQNWLISGYKLGVINMAINREDNEDQPWEPDWNNYNQYKYYPWPPVDASEENPAGVGFSGFGCDSDLVGSSVGSRLCYKSREACEYGFTQFEDLYKEYLLIL